MERRRLDDDELKQQVVDLAVGVVGLKGALEHIGRELGEEVHELKNEIETQRALAKYGRRTWFEVMAWIFLAGVLVSDLGAVYCVPTQRESGESAAPEVCDTVFWATSHGGGWGWRALGFALTVVFLLWMAHRSQVPEHLYRRVPAAADKPDGYVSWYYRWLRRGRRS